MESSNSAHSSPSMACKYDWGQNEMHLVLSMVSVILDVQPLHVLTFLADYVALSALLGRVQQRLHTHGHDFDHRDLM